MLQTDYALVTCVMDQKVSTSLREAERGRMLREAGIDHRPRLLRRLRAWTRRLGHSLAVLGRRLERYDASAKGHRPAGQGQSARS